MTIIDCHQHFWDPAELSLPSLPPEAAVLDRAFLPEDLEPYLRRACVDRTILVQGYPQTHDMNQWLFGQANGAEFVAGVVAWVDLTNPTLAERQLGELQAQPKFVGIRHIVEDEDDPDWIVRDNVLQSLHLLAERDIPYDMLVRPVHLKNVGVVLDAVPDLRMVIDHIAKPDIAGGSSESWVGDLRRLAENQNVFCKLSGMVTEANWSTWKPADLQPFVDEVVDMFGIERIMYGSDWPVCLLAADYNQVWRVANEVLSGLGDSEYTKVFGGNAADFYGLKL